MKTYKIFAFSLLIYCLACEEVDFSKVCNVSDPSTELDWLKDMIENRGDIYQNEISYFSFIFENTVYIQDLYCGNSFILWNSTYFDCKGKEKSFSTEDLQKINMQEKELVWKGTDCD
ncbi:MAG: hypothetical protein R8P61_14765 [Bacteroidia bacterium]|nr:hypothetical protein [Bacteroidia bacterium]